MKRACSILLPILLSAAFLPASGQSRKVFMSMTWDQDIDMPEQRGFSGPQAGFGWQNKKMNWHEFELTSLNAHKEEPWTTKGNLGLRYQYVVPVFRKLTGPLKPFLSAGITSFNHFKATKPDVPFLYPVTLRQFTSRGYIAPGILFDSKKRFFASLSLPVTIAKTDYLRVRVKNPIWSPREQRHHTFSLNTFQKPDLVVRAGAGVKF